MVVEKTISKQSMNCNNIIEMLKENNLSSTIFYQGNYFSQLVRELIVNLHASINNPMSTKLYKVPIRMHCFHFLSTIINEFLCCVPTGNSLALPSLNKIVFELTGEDRKI